MPRKEGLDSIADVLADAGKLRNRIIALPAEVRDGTRQLVLSIVTLAAESRGRPPAKLPRGGLRKVGRPRKARAVMAQPYTSTKQ